MIMNDHGSAQTSVETPNTFGRFGEYDESGVGTDLTLEWDSNDPDLHNHMRQVATAKAISKTDKWIVAKKDDEERYRYFDEAGLPDA